MQIGDFKRFKIGVTVLYEHCNIYDVYMIDVDEDRIELSDNTGMVIGTIDSDQINECAIINYNDDGRMINLSDLGDE